MTSDTMASHSPWIGAAMFAGLKLSADTYQAFYYGVGLDFAAAVLGAVVVAIAGTLGYLCGIWALGKRMSPRTVCFIAFLSYFVAYSLARLLSGVSESPLVFIAAILIVTFGVTFKLGPKWNNPNPDSGTG